LLITLAALRSAPHSLASRYSVQADAKPYVGRSTVRLRPNKK